MSRGATVYILDSFALLAFLEDESGTALVQAVLQRARRGEVQAYLSLINLGEVLYVIERERAITEAHKALAAIEQLPIELLEATRERILDAAHLKANFRLSYADAFVVAAAQELGGTILTGDPEFKAVEALISVEWLPQEKRKGP